ncbi:MAG: ATP-binding protein [Christensenellales bacterium]
MNRQLVNKLNNAYQNKRLRAKREQSLRFEAAMQDPVFANLYTEKRSLENEIARRSAMKLDMGDLRLQLDTATKKYDEYVSEHNLDLQIHYDCQLCKDTGIVDNKPCACFISAYHQLLRNECALSPLPKSRFEDNTLAELGANTSMQQLYEKFEGFCKNFDNSKLCAVWLSGNVGVGKTTLLASIANRLIEQDKYVIYITAFDLSRIFLAQHTEHNATVAEMFDNLFACDLLIIDDLGTEPMYQNVSLEYFLSLVDWRINHQKKTILSSNLNQEQFIARYGERTYSRICNKSYGFALYIDGTDLRKIKSKH